MIVPVVLTVTSPLAVAAHAQCLTKPESVVVIPGAHYRAGWLHARVLGENYRDVWTTPIRVPLLDLCTFAGGLTVIPRMEVRGGIGGTKSVRFRGANGREYVFRSVNKDPTTVLPEALRRTVVRDLVRDLTSIQHPVGGVVVAPILRATGVLSAEPVLAVMPDHPGLETHRSEFAGMLGMIEERPNDKEDGGTSLPNVVDVASTGKLL